jgi:2-oxo-4-hydroxy-4-carboxy-5-ureidoimidazoline decarboxylase
MTQLDGFGLAAFNALPDHEAEAALLECCASRTWAGAVVAGRPYATPDRLIAAAQVALAELAESDLDDALAGHPRIGELPGASHSSWSRREQAGVASAAEQTRAALGDANRAYEERFGHVYLVCATGKSADELLAIAHERLGNDPANERRIVRSELGKINRIRLERLLSGRRE